MPIAEVNGINIDYMIEGKGEPLIMISGGNTTKGVWKSQTRFFKKYYRTIAFDNRGVGKSDKPAEPYTFGTMADDTIGLMDHLDIEKSHIFGMSTGGMVAQELAINYPERVNKLVLACTFAKRDENGGYSSEIEKALETYENSSHDKASLRRFVYSVMDSQTDKWSYRLLIPLLKIVVRFSSLESAREQLERVRAHDSADRLALIKAPTLVITGTEDRAIRPVSSEVIACLIPKAKLVKVEGGGHGFMAEMSNVFNREVFDFLKG
jgi:pimeloyl-ACP methyl ester carboxylesterase